MLRRTLQLFVGLALYGAGIALTVEAGLGLDPWTVLAQGLSLRSGLGIGWITNILGALLLLAWIPLHQQPGVGTLANIAVVGTSLQIAVGVLPAADSPLQRVLMLVTGVMLVAFAAGMYIGAGFGPGPRDGLITGLHRRTKAPVWACTLGVQTVVLVTGWALGGTVGIGTVVFAFGIGPLIHQALPAFGVAPVQRAPTYAPVSARGTRAGRLPA